MHVEQPLVVVHPHLDEKTWIISQEFLNRYDISYLNSARSVNSMGVLVSRERVRVERSEYVTHPGNIGSGEQRISKWQRPWTRDGLQNAATLPDSEAHLQVLACTFTFQLKEPIAGRCCSTLQEDAIGICNLHVVCGWGMITGKRDTQAQARPLDICVSPRHQPCYRSPCSFIFFDQHWSLLNTDQNEYTMQ